MRQPIGSKAFARAYVPIDEQTVIVGRRMLESPRVQIRAEAARARADAYLRGESSRSGRGRG